MSPQADDRLVPLCDKHYCPMEPRSITTEQSKWPVYACATESCTRHYNVAAGYFDVRDGKILSDRYGKQACGEDELALYLEFWDDQEHEETWRCPASGCELRIKRSTSFPDFLLVS
jgi:hypothetical protein